MTAAKALLESLPPGLLIDIYHNAPKRLWMMIGENVEPASVVHKAPWGKVPHPRRGLSRAVSRQQVLVLRCFKALSN